MRWEKNFSSKLGLELFERIPFELNTEHFIAVVFGGAILGAGLSLILRAGGCIDGSEILAAMIVSKLQQRSGRNMSMTGILIAFNACVYTAAFLLINRNSALLSLLVYIVATAVIDHFTDRFEAIKQVTIITKEPDPIINWIRDDMHKTCTVMDSAGAVAGENKTLICYVTYFELQKFREKINEFKGGAFITVSTIDEIISSKTRGSHGGNGAHGSNGSHKAVPKKGAHGVPSGNGRKPHKDNLNEGNLWKP